MPGRLTGGDGPRQVSSSPSRNEAYYGNQAIPSGSLSGDDTSGVGPETFALNQGVSGTFRVFARCYSNCAGTAATVVVDNAQTRGPVTFGGIGQDWEVGNFTYPPGVAPHGSLDVCDGVYCYGWAKDDDWAGPIWVHLYSNGIFAGAVLADQPRPDLDAAGIGARAFVIPHALLGPNEIQAYAIGVTSSGESDGENPAIGGTQYIFVASGSWQSTTQAVKAGKCDGQEQGLKGCYAPPGPAPATYRTEWQFKSNIAFDYGVGTVLRWWPVAPGRVNVGDPLIRFVTEKTVWWDETQITQVTPSETAANVVAEPTEPGAVLGWSFVGIQAQGAGFTPADQRLRPRELRHGRFQFHPQVRCVGWYLFRRRRTVGQLIPSIRQTVYADGSYDEAVAG